MASRTSTPLTHPDTHEFDLFEVMSALVDPVRRGIVLTLATSTEVVACTDFALPVTKSAASRHFRVLREAGIIHQHDVGVRRMNSLRREDVDSRFPGLMDLVLQEATRAS
ncbi:transcriptional regulator (plasmid) [Arthrobacter sp. MN05-02]|nr:transcriptional regulator [Arthrobacter sp. MN05-02]